jgi:hypothetical protein
MSLPQEASVACDELAKVLSTAHLEKLGHALTLHFFEAEAIDARAASLRAYFTPGPPQDVGPVDAVIERVEPTVPTPFGRSV